MKVRCSLELNNYYFGVRLNIRFDFPTEFFTSYTDSLAVAVHVSLGPKYSPVLNAELLELGVGTGQFMCFHWYTLSRYNWSLL